MKKVIQFRYFLVSLLLTSFLFACQKDMQENILSTEAPLAISEKITVPVALAEAANGIAGRSNAREYNTFYGAQVQMAAAARWRGV